MGELGEIQDLPENGTIVPAEEITPDTTTTSDALTIPQPVITEPEIDYKARSEELEQLNKRHLEQLAGTKAENARKDKLLEEARLDKIAKSYQPAVAEPDDDYNEQPQAQQPLDPTLGRQFLKGVIRTARLEAQEKYEGDKYVPFNKELAAEVETELMALDPTGRSLIDPIAWERGYKIVRGNKIDELIQNQAQTADQVRNAEVAKIVATETLKETIAVETPSQPSIEPKGQTLAEA